MVPTNTKGCKVEIIQNKLALRVVQNGQIDYVDAVIPAENKLPYATEGF